MTPEELIRELLRRDEAADLGRPLLQGSVQKAWKELKRLRKISSLFFRLIFFISGALLYAIFKHIFQ